MIITQDGYDPGDDPASVPLIGYDNKITGIEVRGEDADHPVSNLLNSATHLFWRASVDGPTSLVLQVSGSVDYLALARHNLARIALLQSDSVDAISGALALLMHFEETNNTTNFYDNSGNDVGISPVGAGGTIIISNAQAKFGTTSGRFTGGDLVLGTAPTFNFIGDFTIDFWVRHNAVGAIEVYIDTGSDAGGGFRIYKNASNFLVFRAASADKITGASAMTATTWHHVAVTRSGSSTKLFLNGAQQGSTYVDATAYTGASLTIIGANQSSAQLFAGHMDEWRVLYGRADWTAAFTPPTTAWTDALTILAGEDYQALFHFDGADASTTFVDSSGTHTFTAQGNAQLDTAQFKFGTSSALFDGTGDYLRGDGSSDFAFGTGDFTIDIWVRFNSLTGSQTLFDTGPDWQGPLSYILFYKDMSHHLVLWTNNAARITGTTALTTGAWHHVAVTRLSGSTRIFLNGVQEGSTYTDANNYRVGPSHPFIGEEGDNAALYFNGWMDELRVIKGIALWSAPFSPPTRAAGSEAVFGRSLAVADFSPLMFRFEPTTAYLSLQVNGGDDAAEIGVIYAGELLVLERSVKVDAPHANLYHARQASVLAGMSENGNFLGRVLTSEWRESQAEFAWFTPTWYRDNFDPFAEAAMTEPFFWVWNPDEYPEEVAFAWITETIVPETDPATRRVAATISMRAFI